MKTFLSGFLLALGFIMLVTCEILAVGTFMSSGAWGWLVGGAVAFCAFCGFIAWLIFES